MSKIKVSKNWDCVRSFDWILENAKWVYSHNGYKGARPHVVLSTPINGFDIIEIDYDRWGVTTNAVQKSFNPDSLVDYSKNVEQFIIDFLIKDGASDLLTPKPQ